MADNDELLVEVEGEIDNEGDRDPAAELARQFEELKAENKKREESEARANRRAADERAAREAAQREIAEVKATVADTQLDGVVSRIAAAKAEAEAAKRDFAAAAEAGDFSKQAEAQERLANAAADRRAFENEKAYIEARKSDPGQDRDGQRSDVSRRSSDPFEDHVSRFTERTAQWMRDHRDWIVDPKKNAKVTGAHNFAVSEGLAPDTDDYFEFVEKMIGLRQDQQTARNGAGNGQQQTRNAARRVSPPVAPVNGGGHSSGAGENRGQTVILTAGEKRMAESTAIVWNKGNVYKGRVLDPDKMTNPSGWAADAQIVGKPIGIQEFARRKLEMNKGGYYDRSYTES